MNDAEIWFHTPGPGEGAFPYHVVAAGRTLARPGAAPVVRRYNQHVLILTEAGRGLVRAGARGARGMRAGPGTLAWLDTTQAYAHGCDAGAPHWRYRWMGVQGFALERLFAKTGAAHDPVVLPGPDAALAPLFAAVAARMRDRSARQAAANSAAVAQVLAAFLDAGDPGAAADDGLPPAVARTVAALRGGLARRWRVADIAAEAGVSPSQLHRLFRAAFGVTPRAWLRAERINSAKALLIAPGAPVAAVAEAVGYADPFHFSRDFKALTGRSPRAFRQTGGA